MTGPALSAQNPTQAAIPPAPAAVRWVSLGIIAVVILRLGGNATLNLDEPRMQPDFEYFYKSGSVLLETGYFDGGYDRGPGGTLQFRGMLDWYWPFVARFMSLFALFPQRTAGTIWVVMNMLALLATLRMLGRELSGFRPQDWPVTQLLPLLLLGTFWWWEFRLNQINCLTLFLLVLSFVHWQRGLRGRAGFWLGLAILLKLTPGLLVIWFGLKREFRTVVAALLTVFLAGPFSDYLAFGPQMTREYYQVWAHKAVEKGSPAGLVRHQLEMDWRNQGWGAVASRWLHHTNWNTHFDNEPRSQDERDDAYINVVNLPTGLIARIVQVVTLGSLVLLAWLARRPASSLSVWELRMEWALFLLAMLWLMPVMRRYHIIWALPALTVMGPILHHLGRRHAAGLLGGAAILVLIGAQLSLLEFWRRFDAQHLAEAAGVLLFSVGFLAVPLILALGRLRRDRSLLPPPLDAGGQGISPTAASNG